MKTATPASEALGRRLHAPWVGLSLASLTALALLIAAMHGQLGSVVQLAAGMP